MSNLTEDEYLESLPFGGVELPETILFAANMYHDIDVTNHFVFIGKRHCDEFMMSDIKTQDGLMMESEVQGFWTSKDRFVDREEAWKIALEQRQIKRLVGGNTRNGGTLYSENLY